MSQFVYLKSVIALDADFDKKVLACGLPSMVGKQKVKQPTEIALQHMMLAWNIKNDEDSLIATAKAFGLNSNFILTYPLIDFYRLMLELTDVAEKAGKMFEKLKRTISDQKIKEALEKMKNNNPRAIFVEIMKASEGAYTQEQAADMSWLLAYDILEAQTAEFDRAEAINKIQEERMKNGTKRN